MATYVLVHGAWHGSWCWGRVAPLLRARGHEVWTPTLTGLAERSHLGSDAVCLTTHIDDVVNQIEFEDLRDVVLVGHSYGGMVVTGVAGRAAERIRHLVYLDAFVPSDGESVTKMIGAAGEAMVSGPDWRVAVPPPPLGDFGVTQPDDLAWLRAKMTAHPRGTFTEAVHLPVPLEQMGFSRTYVLASGEADRGSLFQAIASRLRGMPAWHVTGLPTGHDMMLTLPQELASLLLSLA